MNPSILMISRKILQTADTSYSFDDAEGTNHGRTLALITLMTVISVGCLFCLVLCCFPVSFPREGESPSDERRRRRAAVVNSLPLIPYGGGATQRIMTDDCPICLGEFGEGECVKLIPYCGHVFHPRCLDTWLESHVTCPLCRSDEIFMRGPEAEIGSARRQG